MEPTWKRETVWRQGHVLDPATAAQVGLKVDSSICCLVVISHDCDIANDRLEVEPEVELIAGRLVASEDGNFSWGKVARKLHLTMTRDDKPVVVELQATQKCKVSKRLLAPFVPDATFVLDGRGLDVLQRWLAARYMRAAFPDAFTNRMDDTKLTERLSKLLKPHGKLISCVYFDLDDGRVIERPHGEPYQLSIVLVFPPGDDPEEAADDAEHLANEIHEAFEKKLADQRGLISLTRCVAISEDDIPLSQARLLSQWRLEHMTLGSNEEQPSPVA
jgi:hypothetical protein